MFLLGQNILCTINNLPHKVLLWHRVIQPTWTRCMYAVPLWSLLCITSTPAMQKFEGLPCITEAHVKIKICVTGQFPTQIDIFWQHYQVVTLNLEGWRKERNGNKFHSHILVQKYSKVYSKSSPFFNKPCQLLLNTRTIAPTSTGSLMLYDHCLHRTVTYSFNSKMH